MENRTDTYNILYNYIDALWRRRYFIAVIMICITILGLIAGLMVPKKYIATTSLATFSTTPPSMKELSFTPDIKEQFAGISAYVTSPTILKRVFQDAGIINEHTSEKTVYNLTNDFTSQLTVNLIEKNAVEIKLTGSNPKEMLAILKSLSTVFISEFLNPSITSTQSAESFLKKQVAQQQKKLREATDKLTEFESKNSSFLPNYGRIYTTRLGQIINELGETETQYKSLLAEKKWLADSLANVNPAIGNLEKAIADNDVKLNEMKAIYTDNYPGIKAAEKLGDSLRAERDKLQKEPFKMDPNNVQKLLNAETYSPEKISQNEKTTAVITTQLQGYKSLEQKINGLAGKVAELTAQKKELLETLRQVDNTGRTLAFLKRDVADNLDVYQELLKRYDNISMTNQLNYTSQLNPIKIVSNPQVTLVPARPLILYVLAGVFGGIFLAVSLALLLDQLDNSVRNKQKIEAMLGLMVISRVGKIKFT